MPEKIKVQLIEDEMKQSYIDYAMSVITARALPDVRDGLKPVHRRILYAMHKLKLTNDKQYRKCAYVVGRVLGSYHPHGDMSVYDALVRLAQDFSMRYPLIQGHGNFGCFTKDTKVILTDGRKLSFEDLIKEYNNCDIFLSTSRLEGFGLSVAEAMSCGKPCIVTNCSSLPELIDNGKGGFLCERDNVDDFVEKIKILSKDRLLIEKMGKYNREKVIKEFSFNALKDKYLKLYNSF